MEPLKKEQKQKEFLKKMSRSTVRELMEEITAINSKKITNAARYQSVSASYQEFFLLCQQMFKVAEGNEDEEVLKKLNKNALLKELGGVSQLFARYRELIKKILKEHY